MSSKDNLALDLEHGVRRWDRARWISVFSSHNPTIREVTECLGLGLSASSSTTNRGIPKFDNPDYRKLSSEVTKLSKELPKERDLLLDFAADPSSLNQELEDLLASYGPAIWGRDADRSCLLTPDATKKTYNKDLFYEEPEHKDILKIHLHRWIIIKACYYIRNMKLKRPSGANEYDQLADIDAEGLSPHGTPQSLTPPDPDTVAGADLDVKPINLKKRKSNAHLTMSDDEDPEASPIKRPYSTMPVSRKGSPRKSLKSLYPAGPGSMENIPPMPTHMHRFSPAPSEPARIQLSPLSNNDLNGASRPPAITQNSAPAGFTAVNNGGFTPVNNTPPPSEPPREPAREATREPSREVHRPPPGIGHRHSNSYTSPYEPSSRSAAMARSATETPRSAPPATPTPASNQGFQAVNASSAANGAGAHMKRESPAVQPPQHTHIAPQPQQSQSQPQSQAQPQQQQTSSHPSHPHQVSPHTHHSQHTQLPSHPHIQAQQQPPPQPPSRSNTPSHPFGRSLAPHPRSRSSTPHAQAAPNQPIMAPNKQVTSAPAIQSAPAYGIQLVPTTQDAPPAPSSKPRAPSNHSQPAAAPQHTSPHQPVLKSHQQPPQPPETAHVVQPPQPQTFPRGSVSTTDLRLLQCEVTAGLFTFFYPRSTMPPDEASLLVRMHTLWYHGEPLFRTELSTHYDLVSKILTAWLHERQAIASLRHSMAANPGVSHIGLVDRLLAMNDLRAMRLKWKNMSSIDGLSPEDLLCMAFRVMTNTEGSEYMFKDGLARLELGVFEFLRSEDAKIVMQRRDTRAG
ncbi:hypothetical protein J4E93_000768 [Alternaria ventricosa]|uniref:uncharacterized protein n=1 Tax=Alternaria ventricosa TaxID=1187951 RepID=UPI0020C2DD98|nr:uncharacterized protein J4E93_000768 [Alternaria ventricosa]KAI4656052.1 hypothetical protein J4E93_000768 [Alternaria ventricosa]